MNKVHTLYAIALMVLGLIFLIAGDGFEVNVIMALSYLVQTNGERANP